VDERTPRKTHPHRRTAMPPAHHALLRSVPYGVEARHLRGVCHRLAEAGTRLQQEDELVEDAAQGAVAGLQAERHRLNGTNKQTK
jgi:hypothetical protein